MGAACDATDTYSRAGEKTINLVHLTWNFFTRDCIFDKEERKNEGSYNVERLVLLDVLVLDSENLKF